MSELRRFLRAMFVLGRAAVTSVAGNVSLAALALALALSLWLFVTERENPKQEEAFNSSIPIEIVNVPNGLAVANASETSVRVRIQAPASELDDLRADDFTATLNMGGSPEGKQSVAVEVDSSNRRVDIVSVTPARVDVTLETSRTKEVPVRVSLVGAPQLGFEAANERAEPDRVIVSGPASLVELVDSAVAEVNLTGLRIDVTDERTTLEPRDRAGGQISRVSANPDVARVSVDLEQREYSLEFTVTPSITGQPAGGYNAGNVTVDPRLIVVTGPLDVLQSIDAVRGLATDEISIADARDDVVRTVDISLPDNVRVEGSPTVRVSIDISPARGESSFLIVPQVRNVQDGLALVAPPSVTVTLSGEVPTLEGVLPESIIVVADAAGLGAGLHVLPLEITPPPGVTVARADPVDLGIALVPRS